MAEQERITLERDIERGIWTATFEGPEAQHIIDLFGTVTLPTPFLDTVADWRVLEAVQAKNPDAEVVFQGQ